MLGYDICERIFAALDSYIHNNKAVGGGGVARAGDFRKSNVHFTNTTIVGMKRWKMVFH